MYSTQAWNNRLLACLCACLVTFCGPLYAGSPAADGAQPGTQIPALGLQVAGLSNQALDRRRIPLGVVIVDVAAGGPAAAAGLQAGDVVYQLNGLPTYSVDRLHWLVERSAAAGYRLSVIRGD